MKLLNCKWFEKAFMAVSGLLLIWLILGFLLIGGFILLLFMEEFQK
ncbi:hypothetical protein [Planococcus sp. 107-1]|nr:hypothetical protein [Planococcus sp. 107-1]UJF26762.1 hypothetical protein L0M13_16760 [Planococcus sp. 107-1]